LVLTTAVVATAYHGHTHAAYADDDDDDGGGGGDDKAGKAGDDDPSEGDEEEEADKDQPPVTAGGLFTKKTFPVRELDRPLTIIEGLTQLRFGVGTDVSDKGAFNSYGFSIEGTYGLKDNVTLLGGFTNAYNFKDYGVYAGFEGALAYDFIDFRAAVRLNQPAAQNPADGTTIAGKTKLSFDIGFPFRYSMTKELAIVALNTLISIDTDSKPDLNPSVGVAANPIPAVSVVAFAQLNVIDFDTSSGNFRVPATVRVQFSPSQTFDLGMEFKFLNLKPATYTDPVTMAEVTPKFYDARFLTLYAQARF
jgi:hypothetical protein